jgi:cell wall assembly regulator SMI1
MELERTIEGVKAWFVDRGAQAIVANLRAGVTEEQLRSAEQQGFRLTDEMKRLYRLHDGQADWEADFFLPNVALLPLSTAMEFTDYALDYFMNCPDGHRSWVGQSLDAVTEWKGHGFMGDIEDHLRPEEWTSSWFCFGEGDNEHLLQNFDTGRIFSWHRKDRSRLVGDSLASVLKRFSDDLANGRCWLSGDPALPGVTEEGFVHRRRYVVWGY